VCYLGCPPHHYQREEALHDLATGKAAQADFARVQCVVDFDFEVVA
jgi:hypothetical protein